MKKKSLSLMLISLLVSTETLIMPAAQAFASVDTTNILPCSCDDDRHKDNCEKEKKETKKDKKDCEKDKKKLCEIQEKIKKGTALDESDKKALFELRDVVFKCKLGDKKYEEFKKLIEKKKCGDKLTEEEEEKLKCYFKELK